MKWSKEFGVRIWNTMMLVASVTVLYSLAFYQLTVLSPTLHNAIQLGNYLAGGATPKSACVSVSRAVIKCVALRCVFVCGY